MQNLVALLALPLALSAAPVSAQDASTARDETWGYSFTRAGLDDAQQAGLGVAIFRAQSDEANATCSLGISHYPAGTTGVDSRVIFDRMCESYAASGFKLGPVQEFMAGSLPTWSILCSEAGDSRAGETLNVTKAKAGEPCWVFSGTVSGPRGVIKIRRALQSFSVLRPDQVPEVKADRYVSRPLRFQIDGFPQATGLSARAVLDMKALTVGGRRAGTFSVCVAPLTSDRAAGLQAHTEALRQGGASITGTTECLFEGREAARVTAERAGTKELIEELLVCDGALLWEVSVTYATDVANGAESKLKDALASFTLLRAKAP